jgi:hypothetical protein
MAAILCGTPVPGNRPTQCADCWNADAVATEARRIALSPCGHTQAEHDQGFGGQSCAVMAISAPQNNARPPTRTTPWQRMGLVSLVNFQTEEAIIAVFDRLDIEEAHRTIWRTPWGALRASAILWNRTNPNKP